MEWGPWEPCLNGIRVRFEYISVRNDGAGKACPTLSREEMTCANCQLMWDEWSECENGQRLRQQVIDVAPFGNGTPCPELQTETEG